VTLDEDEDDDEADELGSAAAATMLAGVVHTAGVPPGPATGDSPVSIQCVCCSPDMLLRAATFASVRSEILIVARCSAMVLILDCGSVGGGGICGGGGSSEPSCAEAPGAAGSTNSGVGTDDGDADGGQRDAGRHPSGPTTDNPSPAPIRTPPTAETHRAKKMITEHITD